MRKFAWACLLSAFGCVLFVGCGGKTDNPAVIGRWKIDTVATQERFSSSMAGHDASISLEFTDSGIVTMRRGDRHKVASWREELGKVVIIKDGKKRHYDLIDNKVLIDKEGGEADGAIFRKVGTEVAESDIPDSDSPAVIKGRKSTRVNTAPKSNDNAIARRNPNAGRISRLPSRGGSSVKPAVQETVTLAKNETHRVPVESSVHSSYVAITPDGKLALHAQTQQVAIYDTSTWKEQAPPLKLEGHNPKGILITKDGTTAIVWGDTSGKALAFKIADRTVENAFAHEHAISAVALSEDGKRLATAGSSSDKTVRVWDLEKGSETLRHDREGTDGVVALSFSQDGEQLTLIDRKGVARVNLSDGQQATRFEIGDTVYSAQFESDGMHAMIGGTIWDLSNGSQKKKFFANSIFGARVKFGPKGKWVATAQSHKKEIVIYDKDSGSTVMTLGPHPDNVNGLAFHPNGEIMVSSSRSAIHVWRLTPDTAVASTSSGSSGTKSKQMSTKPPGEIADNGLLQQIGMLKLPERSFRPTGVRISPDASFLMFGTSGNSQYFDVQSGSRLAVRKFEGQENAISFDFTADGETAIIGDRSGGVQIWNVIDGQKVKNLRGHDSTEVVVSISPDGAFAATAATRSNGALLVWDVEKNVANKLIGHVKPILGVKMLDEGKVVSVSTTTIATWRAQNGKNHMTMNYAPKIGLKDGQCVDFSADGRYILIGTRDGFQLWDIFQKKRISGRDIQGMRVEAVALSDNGRWGLIGNSNREIILWNFVANSEVDSAKTDLAADHIDISYDGEWAITIDGFSRVKTFKIPAKVREATAVLPAAAKKAGAAKKASEKGK